MRIGKKHIAWMGGAVIVLLAGIFWAVDYFSPFRIVHIQLVTVPDNRLRVILKVQTTHACDAVVEYWVPHCGDTLYSVLSRDKRNHEICLTNLEGPRKYEFRVLACGPNHEVRYSHVHPFATSPIYQATPYFYRDTLDTSAIRDIRSTYFLTQILAQPGCAVILNYEGEIVWYAPFRKGVKVSHWTRDRTVLCIIGAASIPFSGGDEILEMDLSGKILKDWKVGTGDMDKQVHHEVREDDQGHIYALTFDKRIFDLSGVGGLRKDSVLGDGIVLFDDRGHKVWEWSVFDHLSPLQDTAVGRRKKDWLHGNSLYREKDGNFLISFRNLDQVWKVEYPSGKVLWKFGAGGDFKLDTGDYFSGQHDAHIDADNQLLLLDNGTKTHRTRALSFVFDSAARTAHTNINAPLVKENFNTSKGSVDLVNGNKLLFSLTDPRLFLLTDLHGRVLWRVRVGGDPYRVEAIGDFLNNKPDMDAYRP